ncbi:MAG TPA: TerC family protein [Methylomirabilota bacterium]|nr:TerC family protein [Methylomirabilota bacterium]
MSLEAPEFWARLAEITFLNLVLSGDNAVVIALAVRALPGRQRLLGQIGGTVGAVVLRLLFVGIITALLQVPLLRLAGGLLLIWIAVKLIQPTGETPGAARRATSFWESVWIIVVADVTMSLDNVLAVAGAAHGSMTLVALGIAMSVPIVVWGSGILAGLMNRYPWIVWAGGGLLGYVAGDMMLEDPIVADWLGAAVETLEYPGPVALAAVLTLSGWWLARRET